MFFKLKTIINKFKKSKDGKILVTNFGYLSLLQIASYAFPLITMPYLAKTIGADGFGKVAFAAAIIVWFTTIADWGFNFTATRDVARNRDNKEKVSEIFSNVFWARILLMFVSFIALSILVYCIPKFRENADVIFATFLLIPGHIMFPDWFFQAIEKMKYITILNLLSKTVFTIAVFIFVKEESDYVVQPLLTSCGFLISGLIAMYYILVKWKYKLKKPSIKSITITIKGSTDIFVNNIMPNFWNSFSTILLGFIWGETANGIYEAAHKIFNIGYNIMLNLSRTFYPFLSRNINKHNIYTKVSFTFSIIISSLLFIFAPILIDFFFTKEFEAATKVLRIISLILIATTMSSVWGTNYLLIKGYERQYRNITIFVSIISTILVYPIISQGSYLGKSWIMFISNFLLGCSCLLYAIKIKKRKNK